jgi:single-stranded-DNA-specific exonuclease
MRVERRHVPADWTDTRWPAHVPPVLRRIYAARGVRDPAAIDYRLAHLANPSTLGGLGAATARLTRAIDHAERVLVVGDYDCDGATGCAVAVRGLEMLGLRVVEFVVPHRIRHGYGLSPGLVASLAQAPDLIVTVDNGIASLDGVAAARERGADVIVTDHHLPGARLPDACAIVNPNVTGDAFPSKALAGVGVIFYLLLALRARLRGEGRFDAATQPDLACLLDLVALGTVADMVPLDRNNRILIEAGLRRIRAGRACVGIGALIEASGRAQATLTSTDIAFALAPRLNAAGRLEDMGQGIACLLSNDEDAARAMAVRLSFINTERRELEAGMVAEAERLAGGIGRIDALGVALFDAHWHAGVVGLVASRLKERLHRPVVAFAPAGEGDEAPLRGSARSIPGFHVRDALADVAARHLGLVTRFGGHAMAAGLSLARGRFADFARAFDAVARERLGARPPEPLLMSDGELAAGECSLELARALRRGGPWGQGFEAPLFDNVFDCIDVRPMGVGHRRLRLRDPRDGLMLEAVMFRVPDDLHLPERLRAVYELIVNDWQGRQSARLIVRHIEAV